MEDNLPRKTTFLGRQPSLEDELQILKVEYLSNHWSDLIQILNFDFCDQSEVFKYFIWRQPPTEDDLKILKVEYLNNHCSDLIQILNLWLDDQTSFYIF